MSDIEQTVSTEAAQPVDIGLKQREAIKSRLAAAGILPTEEEDPAIAPETTEDPMQDEVDDQPDAQLESSDEDLDATDVSDEELPVITMEDAQKVMVQTDDGAKPLSEIMQGNMRQAHYTQQRQVQAETKRKLSGMLDDAVLQTAANKTFLDEQIAQYDGVNWEHLAVQNPSVYQKEKPGFDALVQYRNQVMQRFTQLKQRYEQADKEQMERDWQSVKLDLKYTIPGWNDKREQELRNHAIKRYGFTEKDLNGLADKRFWDMLNDTVLRSPKSASKPGKPGRPRRPAEQSNNRIAQLKAQASKGSAEARQTLQREGIKAKLQRMGIK